MKVYFRSCDPLLGLSDPSSQHLSVVSILRNVIVVTALVAGAAPVVHAQVTTGLTMWLKANAGVTVSGGKVTAWADQSGSGNNGTQATAADEPTFVSNAYNGLPAVQFNGTSDFLSIAGEPINSNQFTIMGVVTDTRTGTDTTFREVISDWSTANSSTSVFMGTVGSSNGTDHVRLTDEVGGASDPNHTQTGVGTLSNPTTPFILTGYSSSSDAIIQQNSTTIYDAGSAITGRNLSTQWSLGQQGTDNNEYWQGDIIELMVYDQALTPSQIAANDSYLGSKYGIAGTGSAAAPEPGALSLMLAPALSAGSLARRRRARPPH